MAVRTQGQQATPGRVHGHACACQVTSDSATPWTVARQLLCPWLSPKREQPRGCRARLDPPRRMEPECPEAARWQAVGCLPPERPPKDAPRPAGQQTWSRPQHFGVPSIRPSASGPSCLGMPPGPEAHHRAGRGPGCSVFLKRPSLTAVLSPAPALSGKAAPALGGRNTGVQGPGAPAAPFSPAPSAGVALSCRATAAQPASPEGSPPWPW